ncbi:MAG: bifunctional tetrahydrofolate synthase/dihydrofolate synthase [Gammaproteobacteria bacterium]|nr:bifunctional tetrahydrofolate synthase/dihydrofolate synthase [Gammaproteobacteria bacterium]
MRFTSLNEWLAWQEQLHPSEVDLGLERLDEVFQRGWPPPSFTVITVAGTNGKGSCVAMLESILRAAGYNTGAYTSPHLLRYNERVRLNGVAVDDAVLCRAFERVDQVRGDCSLTYFEFGTLAAIEIFFNANVDVAILEVGLGGRLDAVNILDADGALLSTVGIDHCDWLGSDRESIGYEKAAIFRSAAAAVIGDPDPPASVRQTAQQLGVELHCPNQHFSYTMEDDVHWRWQSASRQLSGLSLPCLPGAFQRRNAAAVLMLLECLSQQLPLTEDQIRVGLMNASAVGRCQRSEVAGVCHYYDVAHNAQAAAVLAQELEGTPCAGVTHALFGMLKDKDASATIRAMSGVIDSWHTVGLDTPRSLSGDELAAVVRRNGIERVQAYAGVKAAYQSLLSQCTKEDRIVAFGSFYTVAAMLER